MKYKDKLYFIITLLCNHIKINSIQYQIELKADIVSAYKPTAQRNFLELNTFCIYSSINMSLPKRSLLMRTLLCCLDKKQQTLIDVLLTQVFTTRKLTTNQTLAKTATDWWPCPALASKSIYITVLNLRTCSWLRTIFKFLVSSARLIKNFLFLYGLFFRFKFHL